MVRESGASFSSVRVRQLLWRDSMERAIKNNDFVRICLYPQIQEEVGRKRRRGPGTKGDVMTAEVAANSNHRKFIPLLRDGEWKHAAASWILGMVYIDLRFRIFLEHTEGRYFGVRVYELELKKLMMYRATQLSRQMKTAGSTTCRKSLN